MATPPGVRVTGHGIAFKVIPLFAVSGKVGVAVAWISRPCPLKELFDNSKWIHVLRFVIRLPDPELLIGFGDRLHLVFAREGDWERVFLL